MTGLFLDILKKTQARKNSKLKRILMKTQAKFQKNSKNANSTWDFILLKIKIEFLFTYLKLEIVLNTRILNRTSAERIKEELTFVLRAKMEEFVTGTVEGHSFASPEIRKMFNFDFSKFSLHFSANYMINISSIKVKLLQPLLYGVTAMGDKCERIWRF